MKRPASQIVHFRRLQSLENREAGHVANSLYFGTRVTPLYDRSPSARLTTREGLFKRSIVSRSSTCSVQSFNNKKQLPHSPFLIWWELRGNSTTKRMERSSWSKAIQLMLSTLRLVAVVLFNWSHSSPALWTLQRAMVSRLTR